MQYMQALERFYDLVEKLPESTNSVHCRWFQAIVVTCFFVVIIAIIDMSGDTKNVALSVGFGIGGYVIGMRRPDNNGDIACRT